MTRQAEEKWAGDVLVIGAGITGSLVARELSAGGHEVTLVDKTSFGAEQSNHSHGYIHAGYIYRHAQAGLVSQLRDANALWRELATELDVAPMHKAACVCFTNDLTARAAASGWRSA